MREGRVEGESWSPHLSVSLSISLFLSLYQSFSPSLFFSLSRNDKTKIILLIKIKIITFDTCIFRKMLKSNGQNLRDTDNKFTLLV